MLLSPHTLETSEAQDSLPWADREVASKHFGIILRTMEESCLHG